MAVYGEKLPEGLVLPEIEGAGNDYSFLEKMLDDNFQPLPISIVIPVYNRIDMLRRTIAMLTHQSYPLHLLEIIIADDGSDDNPEQLIEEFKEFFDVNYVRQKDEGYRLSHVRNLGVRSARYENIIILDCDMAPTPNLVRIYAKWLALDKKVILIGHRRYVDANNIPPEEVMKSPAVMLELPPVATKNAVMKQSPSKDWRESIYLETNNLKDSPHPFRASSCGNVAFHRRVFRHAGEFDESFTAWGAEDNEFGYRVFNEGYYFVPLLDALGMHQEPPGGREFVDREAGKLITKPMLLDKVPTYRDYNPDIISSTPLVSIYIPAYNAIETISRAIKSALNQTYKDFEVVICNDGSEDGTGEYLEKNYANNPRITIIHQKNGGIGSASNKCIENCKGMFILQLDSDDQLLPNALEELLKSIKDKPKVSCVYGRHNKFNSENNELSEAWHVPKFTRTRMLFGMIVHHPRLFRKRDWAKVGGFSETLENAVDYDFFQKLSEVGEIVPINKILYNYTIHSQSTSISKKKIQTHNTFLVMKSALNRMNLSQWNVAKDYSFSMERAVEFLQMSEESEESFGSLFVVQQMDKLDNNNTHEKEITPSIKQYQVTERWSQKGCLLEFDALTRTVYFEMPIGWKLENTHEDLFRLAHYVLTSPWEDGILDDWEPSRTKGWRTSLCFSGGIDSAACMLLMPSDTVLCYHERDGFKSQLNHANAHNFIDKLNQDGRPVMIIKSNHEQIRIDRGKGPGFSTDLAAAVQNILLADYLELGSIAMGMPLENAYLFHGHTGRDFAKSNFWKHHSEIMKKAGLDLVYPTAGVSEIINHKIVEQSEYKNYAESCLRSEKSGSVCGKCWKCFRKNSMKGKDINIDGEISIFLAKRPLKQAISTLYAIQRLPSEQVEYISSLYPDLKKYLTHDFTLIERYLPGALKLLPDGLKKYIELKINNFAEPMTKKEVQLLLTIDLTE